MGANGATWEQRGYSAQPALELDWRGGDGIDESRQQHWFGCRRCESREASRRRLDPQAAEAFRKRPVGDTARVTEMRCRPATRQVGDDRAVLLDLLFEHHAICRDAMPVRMQLHVHELTRQCCHLVG